MRGVDARIKWCQIDTSCSSNGLVVKWFQLILIVIWFEIHWFACPSLLQIQVSWMSNDLRFRWFGCQLIWNSSGWVINWSQVTWDSLILIWFSEFIWDSSDAVVDWSEIQLIGLSSDLKFSELVVIGFESQMMRLSSDLKFKFKCFVPIPKRQSGFGQKRHLWFCHPMRRHRNPKRQALDSYTTTLMFRDNPKPTKNQTRQKLFFQSTKLRHSEVYMPAVTCGQYKHTRPCPCAVSRNTRMDFFGTQH